MSHFGRGTRSAVVAAVATWLVAACSKPAPSAEAPEALGPADASVAPVIVESTASGATSSTPPEAVAQPASDAPLVQTLFVREQPASCEAEGTRQCLMVRSSEGEEWRLFYADIEGFSYEPAYAYELRVAVSPVAGPPADAPSLHYALVEVVSKKKRP